MSIATFARLTALLDEHQARYRVVEHPMAGKSEEVAKNSWYTAWARSQSVGLSCERKRY